MNHLHFVSTSDGSKTIFNEKVGENYHSKHGALQESRHVFLKSGLIYYQEKYNTNKISVLELGFGTGLNFLVSADYCFKNEIELDYCGIEAYPLDKSMISETAYEAYFNKYIYNSFIDNYINSFKVKCNINKLCSLQVYDQKLLDFDVDRDFDIIYFDAFAAIHQPEMWNIESLSHISRFLKPGGVFVTYAITGDLKRTMKSLGFAIEKVPGAAGKREMLRAIKL